MRTMWALRAAAAALLPPPAAALLHNDAAGEYAAHARGWGCSCNLTGPWTWGGGKEHYQLVEKGDGAWTAKHVSAGVGGPRWNSAEGTFACPTATVSFDNGVKDTGTIDPDCNRIVWQSSGGGQWARDLGPKPPFPLTVHIVEHTHDDVGWQKTIPRYYTDQVRGIIDAATQGLAADPTRKYIYVEMAFFSIWWYEQTAEWREKVTALVKAGQLEFINAGWCMSDEATAHFVDQIDQMTLGHLWLQAQFGNQVVPRVGWHIDPFGHTAATAWLFAKMGFDMFQFGRAPKGVNLPPSLQNYGGNGNSGGPGTQFVWRPMRSIRDNAAQDMFTFWHPGYYGWAPGSCNSDGGCSDKDMAAYAKGWRGGASEDCAHVEALYGTDFSNANNAKWSGNWRSADNVIKYYKAHPELNVTAVYSTPSQYLDAVHSCGRKWEVFEGDNNDFFPYWTGFFTSQPVFKRMVRDRSALLRAAQVQLALGSGDEWRPLAAGLNVLWAAVGVSQHHDGVTGTSPATTYQDYMERLNYGAEQASAVFGGDLCVATPTCSWYDEKGPQSKCIEAAPACKKGATKFTILNSLMWARDETVTVPVPGPGAWRVVDSGGSTVASQVRTPAAAAAAANATTVSFAASVPALGSATYTLVSAADERQRAGVVTEAPTGPFVIENDHTRLDFAAGAKLSKVTNKESGVAVDVSLGVRYYWGSPGSNDGTYDFHAEDKHPNVREFAGIEKCSATITKQMGCYVDSDSRILPHQVDAGSLEECAAACHKAGFGPTYGMEDGNQCFCGALSAKAQKAADKDCNMKCAGNNKEMCGASWRINVFTASVDCVTPPPPTPTPPVVTRGALFSEVVFANDLYSGIQITVRLEKDAPHFAVDVEVGPPDDSDGVGKDVVLQMNTSIATSGEFFTDSSGLELMRRTRGKGTFGNGIDPKRPGANYYPTTALASIADEKARLVWISDRAQGCGSMTDGSLEKMIYRRLLTGDGKGMNTPLYSTDVVRARHLFVLDAPTAATTAMRPLYWRNYYPLSVVAGAGAAPRARAPAALPANVHLLSLQKLSNNYTYAAPYDIAPPKGRTPGAVGPAHPSALPDGSMIVRLHHIYAVGEASGTLGADATVDLAAIFPGRTVSAATEYSLSAAQPLSAMKRLAWKEDPAREGAGAGAAALPKVTLGPMDIRTFVVQLK